MYESSMLKIHSLIGRFFLYVAWLLNQWLLSASADFNTVAVETMASGRDLVIGRGGQNPGGPRQILA